MNKGSRRYFSWVTLSQFFKGMKLVTRGFHKLTNYAIRSNYQDTIGTLNAIESGLNDQQLKFEAFFEKSGIDVHDHWHFSSENREAIR